ncbi:MAG: cadherin-like domain-containing protein, partial [Actinobacteria bacterium]|nr:cadherin-like domain-containing protein [Actinomycetota bacterium]
MLDARYVRENLGEVSAAMKSRKASWDIDAFASLDESRRALIIEVEQLQASRNSASKMIGRLMGEGKRDEAEAAKDEVRGINDRIDSLSAELGAVEEELNLLLLSAPNLPSDRTPFGESEDDNPEVRRWGTPREFDFEAKPNYSIRVRTADGRGGVYEKTFTVNVANVNDAPVAANDSYTVTENATLAMPVLANDSDEDTAANTLSPVLVGNVSHGTLTLNEDRSFTYVNNGDESPTDSFTYKVNDGTVDSNEATGDITITPVYDTPTVASALPDLKRQQDFVTEIIDLTSVFADAEQDALEYSVTVDGTVSASVVGANLTLTSLAGARGSATVTVTATESATAEKLSASNSFSVTVKPVMNVTQQPPTFFDTIQAAIDAATAGDTISVAAGTFSENLALNKRVQIIGQGDGNNPISDTIITSKTAGVPVVTITTTGATVTDRVVVKGVRLTGATGSGNPGSGILFSAPGSHYTFDHVSSVANGGAGMGINLVGTTIADLVLIDCNFSSNTGIGLKVSSTT